MNFKILTFHSLLKHFSDVVLELIPFFNRRSSFGNSVGFFTCFYHLTHKLLYLFFQQIFDLFYRNFRFFNGFWSRLQNIFRLSRNCMQLLYNRYYDRFDFYLLISVRIFDNIWSWRLNYNLSLVSDFRLWLFYRR